MARAAALDLFVEQGSTFEHPLNISDNGLSVDLSLYAFFAQIRPRPGGLLTKAFNVEIQDQATKRGDLILKLSAEDTWSLPIKRSPLGDRVNTTFCYDLIQASPNGKLDRILSGNVVVSPGVTRVNLDPETPETTPVNFTVVSQGSTFTLVIDSANAEEFTKIQVGDEVTSLELTGVATVLEVDFSAGTLTLDKPANVDDQILITVSIRP